MAKILLINGSPNERGCTARALSEIENVLGGDGVKAERLWLTKKAVPDCTACLSCRETGKCIYGDAVNEIGERIDEYDGIIAGSPVYYSGASGRLVSFLDRLFFSVSTEKFAGKLGAAVVSCRRGGATAAFSRINQYFLMTNMLVIGSQYWNQVHGFTPEEVERDGEGLQTMRTLAYNMLWVLRSIEAGKKAGVEKPDYEPVQPTNFIR